MQNHCQFRFPTEISLVPDSGISSLLQTNAEGLTHQASFSWEAFPALPRQLSSRPHSPCTSLSHGV